VGDSEAAACRADSVVLADTEAVPDRVASAAVDCRVVLVVQRLPGLTASVAVCLAALAVALGPTNWVAVSLVPTALGASPAAAGPMASAAMAVAHQLART
jgi:hypothetical protein